MAMPLVRADLESLLRGRKLVPPVALDRAIKALTLVLQAGNFGIVAFDAADAPPHALDWLPFTTWRRLQRMIEGSQTVCVVVANTPMARSAGGITVTLARPKGAGLR